MFGVTEFETRAMGVETRCRKSETDAAGLHRFEGVFEPAPFRSTPVYRLHPRRTTVRTLSRLAGHPIDWREHGIQTGCLRVSRGIIQASTLGRWDRAWSGEGLPSRLLGRLRCLTMTTEERLEKLEREVTDTRKELAAMQACVHTRQLRIDDENRQLCVLLGMPTDGPVLA